MLPINVQQAKDMEGLLPALDRRQPGKPFCLDGENFKWTVQGPESSFGGRYAGNEPLEDIELLETFRVEGMVFFCGNLAIYKYDPTSMTFYPIYIFSAGTASDQYPWTFARILKKYYFCRRGLGVFEYNALTEAWQQITDPVMPANPTAITACRGRLIVLGTSFYGWSEIENPVFTLSLATGAGQQALSLVGGDPLNIRVIVDSFLIYTTEGIGVAEFANNPTVFRHEVLSKQHKAINPFCVADIDQGKHVFVDKKGMFTTTGQLPEPFIPLFGEFLNQTLLKSRDLSDFSVFRLHIANDQQLMFLSVCEPSNHVRYQKSYCLHLPTQKFGSFDRLHYGFGEINIGLNATYDFNFGFWDEFFLFQRFTGEAFNENTMKPEGGYLFHADADLPSYINGTLNIAVSWMVMSAEMEFILNDLESGYYTFDIVNHQVEFQTMFDDMSELGATNLAKSTLYFDAGAGEVIAIREAVSQGGLEAFVILGLFRFSELKYENELGEIYQLSVHSGEIQEEEEDWLELSGEEDLLTSTLPDEDWGLGVSAGDDYDLTLTGTNDGYKVFETHQQDLINLATESERVRRYPGNSVKGLFHHINVQAQEFPKTFHVKTVELTGFGAGRIA